VGVRFAGAMSVIEVERAERDGHGRKNDKRGGVYRMQ